MKDFKCPICGGTTERIWENAAKTRYGMKYTRGHTKTGGKSGNALEYHTLLVPRENLSSKE